MGQEKIIKMLMNAKGEYLSGEAMSQELGVTRTAVWKSISQLRDHGYVIDSVKNKGYSLVSTPDSLEKVILSQGFESSFFGTDLHCFSTIDSTNSEVKRRAMAGAESGLVVVAEEQTAGRGRRGRSFHSPKDTGLYLSFLLRPHCTVEELCDLTPRMAVAVAEGISACCGAEAGIKWTNDLILNGKKISGILTELSLESDSNFVEYVVVGIGINVNHQKGDFPAELEDFTSSIAMETGQTWRRAELCRHILLALSQWIEGYPGNKSDCLEKYRKACITLGKEVQVLTGDQRRRGTALEIDDDFRLLMRYDDGEEAFLSAGEVSIRGMYGYV